MRIFIRLVAQLRVGGIFSDVTVGGLEALLQDHHFDLLLVLDGQLVFAVVYARQDLRSLLSGNCQENFIWNKLRKMSGKFYLE